METASRKKVLSGAMSYLIISNVRKTPHSKERSENINYKTYTKSVEMF